MVFNSRLIVVILTALIFEGHAIAKSLEDEEELLLSFGDEDFVSIATGSRQTIARAPAVATVITAEDIEAIGATDLDQVLETVPGLHVSYSARNYTPIYTIRGIYSETNPQVLILINGVPITNSFVGDRNQIWGGMPINNISRIEIIRGPGSAVYGAEAYAGVINIVTKTVMDINGTQYGFRNGSFDTNEAWMLHGRKYKDYEIAFALQLLDSNGQDEIVDADAQTDLDGLFSTNASLAPGPVNTQRTNIDTRLDVTYHDWQYRFGYQSRSDIGTGAGNAQALDPVGSSDSERINADLTYMNNKLYDNWEIKAQISYLQTSAESDYVLFPPGAFGGAFPNGMIGNPDLYERHTRFGLSMFYEGFQKHKIRLGTGYEYSDMYKIKESKNFDSTFAPLGSVVDESNNPNNVFIRPHDRNNSYIFVQDEWSFVNDWDLTAGIRYDHYSDFGDTINPRFALVWQTRYNLTSKLLYGRAFRAPSFADLYNINNPVALGNPNLEPETIDTIEVAFGYYYSDDLHLNLNLFSYKMKDIIRNVPDPAPATTITAQNTGDQIGNGFELEATWDTTKDITLQGNFAFQDSKDKDVNSDAANAPQMQLYVRADWEFRNDWNLNSQVNWVADRKRAAGDTRPKIDDYMTVDMTLRYTLENSPWEFAFSGHNIFDEDVREPSIAPGAIPNDLPLAGSAYFFEVGYHL